jgi:hypothetical protein
MLELSNGANMEEEIKKEEIASYIKAHIDSAILASDQINVEPRYHHSTSYAVAPSIIKYGFLSAIAQQENGITVYSDDIVKRVLMDDFHVNGNNGISFAVMDLKDLYRDEFEFDPMLPTGVDFIVDIPWRLVRNTENYGNEFISDLAVDSKYIRYLDLRIKRLLIEELRDDNHDEIIARYNNIIRICRAIKKYNNGIILRELSDDKKLYLDYDKIRDYPKIKIKK